MLRRPAGGIPPLRAIVVAEVPGDGGIDADANVDAPLTVEKAARPPPSPPTRSATCPLVTKRLKGDEPLVTGASAVGGGFAPR